MQPTNNMLFIFIYILAIFIIVYVAMYFATDLTTLSKPYSEIILESPYEAMMLMFISVIGIGLVAIVAKYFFERDLKEQDYISKFLEYS